MFWGAIPSSVSGATPKAYNQAKQYYTAGDYTTTVYKCIEV
ncbi:MAG: hypothetical protein ABIF11_06220 [Nitrospirota bacterium]